MSGKLFSLPEGNVFSAVGPIRLKFEIQTDDFYQKYV